MKTPASLKSLPGAGACLSLMLVVLSMTPARADVLDAPAIDLHRLPSLEQILPQLADRRVVFVGENHDQYSHHLVQLAIIRGLHRKHGELAIGLEFFQQPFQEHLDAYVAGAIDETEMLRRTEYMERWGYDY
ncbi:MAG: ChaN family lipoprotein, partial [Thiohalomonadaceae bacterium]